MMGAIPVELGLDVRRTTVEDRDAIAAMYADFEPKAASLGLPPRGDPRPWLERLGAYPNFVLIAGGRVIGHAVLCPDGESAEVAVFVHQDYRGRGLGRLLLQELVNEARRLGLRRVWGITELDNVPMLRLAASLGFAPGDEPGEFRLHLEAKPQISPAKLFAA